MFWINKQMNLMNSCVSSETCSWTRSIRAFPPHCFSGLTICQRWFRHQRLRLPVCVFSFQRSCSASPVTCGPWICRGTRSSFFLPQSETSCSSRVWRSTPTNSVSVCCRVCRRFSLAFIRQNSCRGNRERGGMDTRSRNNTGLLVCDWIIFTIFREWAL